MADLFGRMDSRSPGLFVVRRLDMRGNRVQSPAQPLRSPIHCFFFLTAGEALIAIGGNSYFFRANECATIPAGELFSVRYFDDCTGYMGGFGDDFLSSDADGRNLVKSFGFMPRWGVHKVGFDEQRGGYVSNIFERLHAESAGDANLRIIRAYLIALLTEIETVSQQGAMGAELSTDSRLCNDFIRLAFDTCLHDKPLSDYAGQLSVTVNYLQKVVKRATGRTPVAWITEAVLLEARALLCHTRLSVAEVAHTVGIDDPSYFSRLFKKHSGMTPVGYREKMKNP